MAERVPTLVTRFFDTNGDPLAGGKLYSYIAGTSTLAATFVDQAGITPNTNPVICDANGQVDIWIGGGAYKFILTDAADVVQFTVDNISTASATTSSNWAQHAVVDGQSAANLVGQTVDFSLYSSALYDVEIIRGITVIANGMLAVQNLNSIGRVVTGIFMASEPHGVTFSVSQAGLVAQLKAALDTGAGSGTIKLSRRLIPV